ncbi:MAG: glucose-6-phosphate dehydrogenase [Thermotaleaceae bacterium]
MVIFGGTGDLTHRKLIPALYHLAYQGLLPENFAVAAVGRREKSEEVYRQEVLQSVEKYARFEMDQKVWRELVERIYYIPFSFEEDEGYKRLRDFLEKLDQGYHTGGNRFYYLAVSPESFPIIVERLKSNQLTQGEGWHRLVIEKPFGQNLDSAQRLNEKIQEVFLERDTYRIDHYLGKEMIQNMMVIRFANSIFEPLWNHQYIDHIQITAAEQEGVGSRGGYYEKAGALRDMVQNHILQLLAITAMEPPYKNDAEAIRDEKVKILRSIRFKETMNMHEDVTLGQYRGYLQEQRVDPNSTIETFAGLKLFLDSERWKDVPFYIRTGKMLKEKMTQVVVQFKKPPLFYSHEGEEVQPNLLIIRIQPEEGAVFQFNAKKPGTLQQVVPVDMNFCQNCHIGANSPEAYEKLLLDVMEGDASRFTRWDEVEQSWKFIDSLSDCCTNKKELLETYSPGGWGPIKSEELLLRDKRKWWNL